MRLMLFLAIKLIPEIIEYLTLNNINFFGLWILDTSISGKDILFESVSTPFVTFALQLSLLLNEFNEALGKEKSQWMKIWRSRWSFKDFCLLPIQRRGYIYFAEEFIHIPKRICYKKVILFYNGIKSGDLQGHSMISFSCLSSK